MTKIPENFDYDNFLDMYRTTLTATLFAVGANAKISRDL